MALWSQQHVCAYAHRNRACKLGYWGCCMLLCARGHLQHLPAKQRSGLLFLSPLWIIFQSQCEQGLEKLTIIITFQIFCLLPGQTTVALFAEYHWVYFHKRFWNFFAMFLDPLQKKYWIILKVSEEKKIYLFMEKYIFLWIAFAIFPVKWSCCFSLTVIPNPDATFPLCLIYIEISWTHK